MDLSQEWDQSPLELVVYSPVWHAFRRPVRCEVVHSLPLVRPRANVSCLHMRQQLLVPVSHRSKLDVGGGFGDRFSLTVEHYSAIGTISHA